MPPELTPFFRDVLLPSSVVGGAICILLCIWQRDGLRVLSRVDPALPLRGRWLRAGLTLVLGVPLAGFMIGTVWFFLALIWTWAR